MTEFRRLPSIELLPLSQADASVYPVLCCESKYERPPQISQENIARKCGRSVPTVRKGIKKLETRIFTGDSNVPVVQVIPYTVNTVHLYKYRVEFITDGMSPYFEPKQMYFFYTSVIKSGAWGAVQKNRSHVVYLALRSLARPHPELYYDREGIQIGDFSPDMDDEDRKSNFFHRYWDVYRGTNAALATMAHVTQPFLASVLDDLRSVGLVEWYEGYLLVYRQPAWMLRDQEPPPRVRRYLETIAEKV